MAEAFGTTADVAAAEDTGPVMEGDSPRNEDVFTPGTSWGTEGSAAAIGRGGREGDGGEEEGGGGGGEGDGELGKI